MNRGYEGLFDPLRRYSRQMLVEQIGRRGQEKLAGAGIRPVDCGALGRCLESCFREAESVPRPRLHLLWFKKIGEHS